MVHVTNDEFMQVAEAYSSNKCISPAISNTFHFSVKNMISLSTLHNKNHKTPCPTEDFAVSGAI
jgi:hypothetical protein